MTVAEFASKNDFTLETGDGERSFNSVYCCDLLSIVMGRAPADCGWVTVMGNRNAVAVAVLADAAFILLAEGMALDDEARAKAAQENVSIICTKLPVYEAATLIASAL